MRAVKLTLQKTLDLPRVGEVECEILVSYYPGHPGSFYKRNGDPGDPPEPPEADLLEVRCNGVELAEFEYSIDQDWLEEAAAEAYSDYMEPEEL